MTEIVINLQRGPDDQPKGQLRTGTGQTIPFTGWLHLIRVLEDQLRHAPHNPANQDDPERGQAGMIPARQATI